MGISRIRRLIEQAGRTADPAARLKVFQDAEAFLVEQVPLIPLYFYTRNNLRLTNVEGWYGNVLDIHPYKGVYLK